MSQDSLSFTLTQISYLVSNLNKKNFTQNSRQLALLVKSFGLEADRHLLRCLFSNIDFGDAIQVSKNSLQAKLLTQELKAQLNKSSLITNICFAIDNCFSNQKSLKPTVNILNQISRALNCSPILEVVIVLALTHSTNPDFVRLAENQLKIGLTTLIQQYVDIDTIRPNQEGGLNDISPELLQLILSLLSHGKYKKLGLSEIIYNKFIGQLARDFPRDRVPLILAPLIYTEDTEISADKMTANSQGILTSAIMDTSWPNLVMDIGYSFTASVEECKTHLINTGRDIISHDVAKIIALMCRTHTNLSDCSINLPTPSNAFWQGGQNVEQKEKTQPTTISSTAEHTTWKPEIFVQALKEVAANINWTDVCFAFDHREFIIIDRIGLNILITTTRLGMQSSGVGQHFPVDCICNKWKNSEGQLSLISMILKNPDIYSFADHIYKSVQIESLKTPPELDNKEIASWKSIHLVEALLTIADQGFCKQVMELFKTPKQHCPDILFMALLQVQQPMTVMRHELFTNLVPTFLGNHPNSGTILHHAWNSTNHNAEIRQIIMLAMSEWYLRGDNDQSRLSRILDVAQDLKALSNLLNARSFMFVIDLACLASRREYLKLEKWLSDKIFEHGEPFVCAIVKFLQRRCPQIMGAKMGDDQIPKAAQLPHETLNTIMSCLQHWAPKVKQEITETILTMASNCSMFLNKTRQPQQQQQQPPPPNVLRSHRVLEAPFSTPNLGGMFTGQSDAISALNSNMGGLNITGPGNAGAFNFNNVLSSIVSTPASPSRLLQGPSNSPFPIMSLPTAPPVNNLGRIPATPTSEKLNPFNTSVLPDIGGNVSKEVEDEANSYFQQIYNHPPHPTLSIDEVLDMLQRFQESSVRHERDVYNCMLRNLFEEYRFFPQYPDKELITTAQLFGGMVDRNLVQTYMVLGLALRFVLDALRKPETSKMYSFGITALDRFKTKLHLYQKYCEHVKSIPHFNQFPAHIIEYVEFGYQGLEPPNKPQGQLITSSLPKMGAGNENPTALYRDSARAMSLTPSAKISVTPNPTIMAQASRNIKSIANATNINTLLVATADRDEKIINPPDSVQDKTAFIFNNLSQLNLQQKCDEMKEILIKDYYGWLSQYMVLKRASIEINFHVLYSNFLDALKIPDIVRLVTKESFRNIRVLLRSEKGVENFSDRTLLKNLGHWLGMMTLGRNRPILQVDLDLKSLIVEAYHKSENELLYVIPFVAKVLESCAKSRVFKPPNPWTMGIMNVLAELHQEPDLKLNLKFEIEVLCKNFNIDVANLKPTIYLKDPERALNIDYQLSQPKQKELHQQQQQQHQQQQLMSVPVIADDIVTPTTVVQSSVSNHSPIQSLDSSGTVAMPVEPRFSYMDISVTSISNLAHHIVFSPNIAILHTQPHLKQLVRTAIERTITEWINPVVERSVRIGVNISEQLIRKDFALDPDETRMRTAAHYMVRNLTASMAMITCKDQLLQTITTNIKTAFQSTLPQQPPELINEAVNQLAMDNTELACAFIQKTAIEKAIPDIDKRLTADFDMRKIARPDRRYYDPNVLAYQSDRMPEQIKLKVGGVDSSQFAVYEEFARNIPGFQAMSERDAALFIPKASLPDSISVVPFNATAPSSIFGPDEFGVLYEDLGAKMDAFLTNVMNIPALQVQLTNVHALLEHLVSARRNRDSVSTIKLLNKAVDGLLEGIVSNIEHVEHIKMYRDLHLRTLRLLQDGRSFGPTWTNRAITKYMVECREEIRYNLEAVDILISSNFVNLNQYDTMLANMMDSGSNYVAVTFAMQLVQHYLIDDRSNALVTESDFSHTIDLLYRLSTHPRAPEGLAHLIEMLRLTHDPNSVILDRAAAGPTQHIHSGILQVRSNDEDPPDFQEKAEFLLKDWVNIFHTQATGRDPLKSFGLFVNKMNMYGILKTDDLITRFFRQATQLCIDLVYRNLSDPTIGPQTAKTKIYQFIDAFVRLIGLIVKHSGDNTNHTTKLNLLNKVLGIIVGVLLQDQELHGAAFQQLGYHRLYIMLFLELTAPEPILESITLNVVTAFCHTYHILRPSVAPGFCYSWLELISHRIFIGRILAMIPQQKGWSMYSQLLLDLFKYLAPFLRNAELAKPVQLLYKGTLRVLLVLLHDFPEFLCDYHFGFCDVIPPNCIQMRNLILAAFPRNMRLPDPFTPNLKVDMLSEIATAPTIFTNYVANIHPLGFKKDLDSYLKVRTPVTFLSELRGHLQISNEPGSKYNVALMNSLVLYTGIQAITHIRSKNLMPNMTTILHSAHMDIFQNLAVSLDNEGRYLFLNAIANQLRYPNSHTHYFSCALLYLFIETNSEAIQEQITRVLLERLIVNRPHPWGLLITFIELIKNPIYKFWEHDFVHCAPEIEKLFESVARSCMVVKSNNHQQIQNESDLQECN